jgi:CheY-like chemotaxis protein
MPKDGMSLRHLIVERREELIKRTAAKVAQRPSPRHSAAQLEHGVSLFLHQLAEALDDEERIAVENEPNGPEPSSTETIMRSATLHGQDLRKLGFTIEQVVYDYGDICQAVTELAMSEEAAVTAAEFHTLNRCLDHAIAAAVSAWNEESYRQTAVERKTRGAAPVPPAVTEVAREPAIDAGRGAERETVFVVDRDPHVRWLMQQFVGDAYAVVFFDDGYSALDGARKSPPSALLTEILIPRLDGLALCRLLKGDPVTEHVPILVFSMLAADERARQAGADAFLDKPLEKRRFVESLRGLTESKRRRKGAAPSQEQLAS